MFGAEGHTLEKAFQKLPHDIIVFGWSTKFIEYNYEKMGTHQISPGYLGNMDYFRFLNFLLPICFSLISQLELKLGIGGTSYEDFIRSMHLPMQLRYSSYLGLLSLSFSSFEFDLHLLSLWCI
jgi:hypothetical protein